MRAPVTTRTVVAVGKESVGKSRLISSLTGRAARSSNFRGTTVACEEYGCGEYTFVDTPGISRESDGAAVREALERLGPGDPVLLVVPATHLDEDLRDLLPLVEDRRGAVVVTHRDRVSAAPETLERLSRESGLRFIPVDARHLDSREREEILAALDEPARFPGSVRQRVGWRIEPRAMVLERPRLGPLLALALLLAPAVLSAWIANTFAGLVEPAVEALTAPPASAAGDLPEPLREVLAGDYGLLTMGPLLFVWAAPTVLAFALFLGAYEASGLLDRATSAVHPLLRPFGLGGRDLARVVMGFGCNVPAVISARSCSGCSRVTCVSTVAFGSACSYQLGATLGVLAAAGLPQLALPYLLYLGLTTLVYTRLTSPPEARSPLDLLPTGRRTFLQPPAPAAVWSEARNTLNMFLRQAVPVFLAITAAASALNWLGAVPAAARLLAPAMSLFNLPAEAALPVVLASIRKDGILLFAEGSLLESLTPLQILTGVYLAGVLLPCLVTALTIAREHSRTFALKLLARQALFAAAFTAALAWVGRLFF
jgi:ferrous iron transport protein B